MMIIIISFSNSKLRCLIISNFLVFNSHTNYFLINYHIYAKKYLTKYC